MRYNNLYSFVYWMLIQKYFLLQEVKTMMKLIYTIEIVKKMMTFQNLIVSTLLISKYFFKFDLL